MALFTVVHEAGFETRFNTRHNPFVDIGFARFATSCFDIDVDELLPVDNTHTGFFRMGRIEKHAFHLVALLLPLSQAGKRRA